MNNVIEFVQLNLYTIHFQLSSNDNQWNISVHLYISLDTVICHSNKKVADTNECNTQHECLTFDNEY